MRYTVLGPLEVVGDQGLVPLPAARHRIVLAVLLLESNRVVPVDRLVDAVWADAPPPTARGQIQICVSAIRRSLAEAGLGEPLETRAPGYLFRVAEDELDLLWFGRLVARGRADLEAGSTDGGVDLLRSALELWRGTPLADVDSSLVRAAALGLAERRLTVLEQRIEAELRLGRHQSLIGELIALTAEHPVRERLRGQLMLALYRDGRQGEALETYQTGRRALLDDLGLEPGRDLQRLHRLILAADSEIDYSAPSAEPAAPLPAWDVDSWHPPHLLPADIADFTGYEQVVDEIVEVLQQPGDGEPAPAPAMVSISGKGGVGKTTVALHVANLLADSFPDGQLYVSLRAGEGRPVTATQVLERFLRSLGIPGQSIPELVEERAEMFRNRISGRRLLLVFDDAANENQLEPLLPGGGRCSVVITSRVRLTRLGGAHRVQLAGMPHAQATALLEQVVGAPRVSAEPSAVRDLVDLCGALPLAVRITAARLAARPHWPISKLVMRLSDEGRRLDELRHGGLEIRTNIQLAYDAMPGGAQRLMRRLALLDVTDFPYWVAIPLLDVAPHEAEDLLESLVDNQLLDVTAAPGVQPRFSFHDLIRVFARERLAADEQAEERHAAIRRVAGAWLSLAREAHRRDYGGDYTVLHGEAGWSLPGHVVDDLLARPLEWYEAERLSLVSVVQQSADADLDEICWDLAITMVTLFEVRGYFDDWRETHEIALASVRRGRNRRGEAAMLYSLGSLRLYEQRFEEAGDLLKRSMEMFQQIGDRHGTALAARHLAYIDRIHGDLDAALARQQHAVVELRAVGDPIGAAQSLSNIAAVHLEQGRHEESQRLLEEVLSISRVLKAHRVETQALFRLGESFLRSDDLQRAEEIFAKVLELVRAGQDVAGEAHTLYGLGLVQLRLGKPAEAELLLAQARQLGSRSGERLLAAKSSLAIAEVARALGQRQTAVQQAEQAERDFRRIGAEPWTKRAIEFCAEIESAPT